MNKKKYQCKTCGEVLIGELARREHCKTHHPSTRIDRLDVYFAMEYREIAENDSAPLIIRPGKVHINNRANVEKVKSQTVSSFDCSRAIPVNLLRRPKSSEPDDLFEFAVKRVAQIHMGKASLLDPKTIIQWRNICFGFPDLQPYEREDYIRCIKNQFGAYLKRSGFKFAFDFEQIVRDFPYYFEGGEGHKPLKRITLDALIAAVQTEIELSQKPKNRLKYKVKKIERIDATKHLYQFYLDLGDDDTPSFYEGINIKLKVGDVFFDCEGIDYDITEEILTIRSQHTIFAGYGIIYMDTTFILLALRDKLYDLRDKGFSSNQPVSKFIPDKTRDVSIVREEMTSCLQIVNRLDTFQLEAYNAALKQDICFIWGPPGTGKSFTLAALINSLFLSGSSTLVCCISNVAVDQLLNKVIDVVQNLDLNPSPGQFLRSGHTVDSRLMQLDYLFPSDSETKRIRARISELNDKIASTGHSAKSMVLFKEQLIDLRDTLKERVETLIGKSTIVFSTIANYVLSKSLADKKFDNLIVDEASMISLPYLMAIGGNIARRIILVGDPNQLGPIAINPNKLMHDNVFDYCDVLNAELTHPALHQLLAQRRSHTSIVNLTNKIFYEGRLRSMIKESPEWIVKGPLTGKIVKVINSDIENNIVKPCGSSRRNFGTCQVGMNVLAEYYKYWRNSGDNISIGIVTPYRAQVRLYYAKVRATYGDSDFYSQIKIGTIHTFQGSECDIILFDLVEESSFPVSRLLNDKDGERLITVALTRARHKLIVIGDTRRFDRSTGIASVSNKVRRVLKTLSDRDV